MLEASAAAFIVPRSTVERGIERWLQNFKAMLLWHLVSLRTWLVVLTAVQVLSGVGFVLGISLFFTHIPVSAALFVSTGVPVINLLMVGLILGPQLVADQRTSGSYEYLRSMPVSRSVTAAAWYAVCLIGGIPAMIVSLVVAQLRYDLPLHISLAIIPAVLFTSLAGTMLGYALAHAIASPMVTRMITQMCVFVVFGFAPILFPIAQMPVWLANLNWWFPFRHMAVIIRSALTSAPDPAVTQAYIVLGVWVVASAIAAGWMLGRRP